MSDHSSFAIRRRRAFTLIELVSVITILGIIGVFVGGPTLSYTNKIRSRSAAGRLVGDIRYIQRLAMSSRNLTWITFNTGANNYQLYVEDANNPGKVNRLALEHPLDQSTTAVQFGSGPFLNVSISSLSGITGDELEFDSFGIPYNGSSVQLSANGTITLSNGVTITVNAVSGFAEQSG